MQNKKIAELFKQKFLLESKRDEEISKAFKSFLRGIVVIGLFDVFGLILRRIFFGSERFIQELISTLPWAALGLSFLTIFTIFFCYQKYLFFQKKNNEIEKRIIKELSKE
ncbi:MAG: hypothetical protein mread185_000156 [Mycoplasmataceae bacterium]|nr:MAG: hypothetical protein mread185_000156 [Mycoplasmataceae bacterium]